MLAAPVFVGDGGKEHTVSGATAPQDCITPCILYSLHDSRGCGSALDGNELRLEVRFDVDDACETV